MTLKRMAYAGSVVTMILLLAAAVSMGNQRLAYAFEVPGVPVSPCEDIFPHIPGMPGCGDANGGNGNNPGNPPPPPVNPCTDIFPHIPNMPECGNGGGGGGPTDVCPNIDGIQTEVPPGKVIIGGNCVDEPNEEDDEDIDPAPGTGGGGGGSSGGFRSGGGGSGAVLGAATEETLACSVYLTAFIKTGQANDSEQVSRLQNILKNYEGADIEETGIFDTRTLNAVRAFQIKYADEILTPWGITEPTGYVFLTTRKKLNEVYCANTESFPLTAEEEQHIARTRVRVPAAASQAAAVQASVTATSQATEDAQVAAEEVLVVEEQAETTQPAVNRPGSRIKDFFRRIFDRFR